MNPALSREEWSRGIASEIAYWDRWLGGHTPHTAARDRRLSPDSPLPWWVRREFPPETRTIHLLDVGAGPATTLGTQWPDHEVHITAVDPLADEYDRLLAEHGFEPPVRTQKCFGEDLLERFGPERFDFVFACNSLDHSRDPICCYEQMMAVLKPGRTLITYHIANEGQAQNYEGLHQWNFSREQDEQGDRLVVWNEASRRDLFAHLPSHASATIEVEGAYLRLRIVKQG